MTRVFGRARFPWLVAIGLALVAVGIAPEFLGVGSRGVGLAQGLVMLVGAVLVAAGIFGRRIFDFYRDVAVAGLTTVILLLCLDIGARVMLRFRNTTAPVEVNVTTSRYYRTQAWGSQFIREVAASRARAVYEPYILWSRRPFRGQTVNIDGRGERITPGAECSPGALTIFVLGGSTTWGVGSPDWATIPAFLQQGIARDARSSVCVHNLGEVGFVSTQEVIKLTRELREGRIPNLVVFYDGINDVLTAFSSGRAGVHYGLEDIRTKLEEPPLRQLLSKVSLYQLVARSKPESPARSQLQLDLLAQAVVDNYRSNVRMVSALAREYGFQYEFFWQPTLLVGRNQPIDEERKASRLVRAPLARFYENVYERVEDGPNVHVLTHVLDTVVAQAYVDFGHLLPDANRIVAAHMLVHLAPALARTTRH